MEELLATIILHGSAGEFGRISALLEETAQDGSFSADVRSLLRAALDLRFDEIKLGMSALRQHTSEKLATIALFIEFVYLSSCPLKDNDRIEVLQKSLELDFISITLPLLLTMLAASIMFNPSALLPFSNMIENKTDGILACCALAILLSEDVPDKFHDKLNDYMSPCLKSLSSPVIALANTMFYLKSDISALREYLPMVTARYTRIGIVLKDLQSLVLFDPSAYDSAVEVYRSTLPPGMQLIDHIKQSHFPYSRANQLGALLSIACFNTESDLNSVLFTAGRHVLLKDIGNVHSPQQLSAVCSFLVGMLRSCPLVSVCDTLRDLLAEVLSDPKLQRTYKTPLQILKAYLSSAKALLHHVNGSDADAKTVSEEALTEIKQVTERLDCSLAEISILGVDKNSLLLTIEDLNILMLSLSGNHDKAVSKAHMLADLDIDTSLAELDAPASPSKLLANESSSRGQSSQEIGRNYVSSHATMNVILSFMSSAHPARKSLFSIMHGILPSLIAKAKNPLANMIGVGPLHANVCYSTLFPDTLALTVLSKYIIHTLKTGQDGPLLDNEAKILTTSYNIILSLLISSPTLRLANLHLLSFLQEHHSVIKHLYALSSLASEHGFVGLTTDELFLATTSSNVIGNTKEVQLFLSQAVLLDPSIEQTPKFASVVSKIYSARGDWSQAIKSLSTILTSKIITLKDDSLANTELLPLRVHIALLKLRLFDESGYHDLKAYLSAVDSELTSQGRRLNPLSIEPYNSNLFYVHMQLSYLLSKMTVFCLINAGVAQVFNLTDASENLFTALQTEYALSFLDSASVVGDLLDALTGTDKNALQQASTSTNSFPYLGAAYGPDPFPFTDIFVNPSATNMAYSMSKSLVTSETMSLHTALAFVKPYLKTNREIGDFVCLISLHLKNDKAAYIQHFLLDKDKSPGSESELSYDNASPSKLFSLASAYQFVGKTKESSRCLEILFTNHKKYAKSLSLRPDSALLFQAVISTLYVRSLCKTHYFLKAEAMLVELVTTLLETWNRDLTGYSLSYTLVFSELVRLLYRMGKEADIAHLTDATVLKLTSQYQLPQTADVSTNHLPTDVVFLAVYSLRCRIALKDPATTVDDKITKLQLAINWFTSCVVVKTGKTLTTLVRPKVLIRDGVFSSKESAIHNPAMYQNTQVSSPLLACKARVLAAEMYLELAYVYLESTGILTNQVIQPDISLDPVKKGMAKSALDFIKRSIDLCESSKAYLLGAVLFSVVANDYVTANEYVNHALELPVVDTLAEDFHSQLKLKLKTEGNNETDMDDFNADFQGYTESGAEVQDAFKSPFEQLVHKLKRDMTCDRASTLDTFLMQSCTRQDPWNLHNLLFGEDNDVEMAGMVQSDTETSDERGDGSGCYKDEDNNDSNDYEYEEGMPPDSKGVRVSHNAASAAEATLLGSMANSQSSQNAQSGSSLLDGYWFLGLGFICIKTGRVKDGVPYLIASTKLHTLQESYKARAYFVLGTTYLNSTRTPLFGYQSALTTKSTSAVAMQKMAMKLSKSGGNPDEENVDETGDGVVPTLAAIEAQEEDVNNAVKSLKELEKLSFRNVAEAASLHLALLCYIKVTEYKLIKDKINRVMLDEGKGAKVKVVPLESKKDKIKDDLEAAKDDLLSAIEEMSDMTPNIIVLLTCLGIVFTHLKNHPRARNQFKRAAGIIPSVNEIIATNQVTRWLDLDAAVSANLALADLYITTGKLSNAIKSLEAISQQDHLNAISYELYGLVMEKEASYNDACKYYESAWLLSRGASTVAFRLAYNYIKSNRYEDAVVMCQLALREWSDYARLRKEVLYLAERRLRTSSI